MSASNETRGNVPSAKGGSLREVEAVGKRMYRMPSSLLAAAGVAVNREIVQRRSSMAVVAQSLKVRSAPHSVSTVRISSKAA